MKIAKMKTAAVLVIAVLGWSPVYAQAPAGEAAPGQPAQSGADIEKFKATIIKDYQGRIQILQQSVSCIQAAKDQEAMRTCRQNERQAIEQLRANRRPGPGQSRGPRPQGMPPRQ